MSKPKTTTAKKIKKGSRVFAIHNHAWGMACMRVVRITERGIIAKNPDYSETGYFAHGEYAPFTVARSREIKNLAAMEKAVSRKQDELFH